MAAIYGNNLHEKLVGVAISKEHLKYNTPFCDLVDDPEWEVDINLALDYNSATTGNRAAADRAVQSLTLNSSILDGSTIDFYVHKMTMSPAFNSAIRTMNYRWANPNSFNDEFQFNLLQALKDCLNSPCNLFNETSDSIGRMAQAASTNTSGNTFGFGALSASFVNMIDGLDQTIFNKIPAIFQDAFVEVTQVANKAYTNTQAVLAGKENLTTFNTNVTNGTSFRNPSDMFRYTPDVKSSYDYSAASSNILSKVREEIGGCFNRFESKYRYNPYENNLSRPLGTKTLQVNGRQYDVSPDGKPIKNTDNSLFIAKTVSTNPPTSSEHTSVDDNSVISDIYTYNDHENSVTTFAAFTDVANKVLWYTPPSASPSPNGAYLKLAQGVTNMSKPYLVDISNQGTDSDFIKRSLNGDVSEADLAKYGSNTQAGAYAAGFKHDLTDTGMETLYDTSATKTFNDGVAISAKLFNAVLNNITLTETCLSLQKANKLFIAARPVGEPQWAYYKVCHIEDIDINFNFTLGAFKHFITKFNIDGGNLESNVSKNNQEKIPDTEWYLKPRILGTTHPIEIRICAGDITEIKAINVVEEDFGDLPTLGGVVREPNFDLGLAGSTMLPEITSPAQAQ